MDTYNDPEAGDGIYCDESGYLFGHPLAADCKIAQNGIGDGIESLEATYEFMGVGAQSIYNGFGIAQTPFNWTTGRWCSSDVFSSQLISIGTCYIQVSMLEGGYNQLENWDYIWGQADAIRQKCVVGLGVGGTAKAGKTHHSKNLPQDSSPQSKATCQRDWAKPRALESSSPALIPKQRRCST